MEKVKGMKTIWHSVFQRVSVTVSLALALLCASTVYADTYVNRPGVNDFDEAVEKGTWTRNAIHERKLVLKQSSTLTNYCGTRSGYFRLVQNFTQTLPPSFVDHTQTIEGKTSVPMFTLTTWRDAAGLNTNGFRRVTEWDGTGIPTFCYGIAQDGDIMGYWIFDDLQKGLSTLKWTTHHRSCEAEYTGAYVDSWEGRIGGVNWEHNYATAVSATRSGYDQGWTSNYPGIGLWMYYSVRRERIKWLYWPGGWSMNAWRVKSSPKLTSIVVPSGITYNWECYILGQGNTTNDWYGWNWNGTLRLWDSVAASSSTQIVATVITDNDNTFPFDLLPDWLGDPDGYSWWQNEEWRVDTVDWVLKWNFTYNQ